MGSTTSSVVSPAPGQRFLSLVEVAEQVGVSVRTVCNLRNADPPLIISRVGNRCGVWADHLAEYIRRSRLPAYQPLSAEEWFDLASKAGRLVATAERLHRQIRHTSDPKARKVYQGQLAEAMAELQNLNPTRRKPWPLSHH
jgi:hypothetical protein